MPDTLTDQITEGGESLRRRTFIGNRCLAIAWDGPWSALETVEGDDRQSAFCDAVSDILTAVLGPYGAFNSDNGDFVAGASEVDARALLDQAVESWIGDAEDYDIAESE